MVGCVVLTPNENAVETLGVQLLSLEALARLTLGEGRVANPLEAQSLLCEAVEESLGGGRQEPRESSRVLPPA